MNRQIFHACLSAGLAAGLVAGLAACGGSSAAAGSGTGGKGSKTADPVVTATATGPAGQSYAGSRNPCTLTTASVVSAAFGGPVPGGTLDTNFPLGPQCLYKMASSNLHLDGEVMVGLLAGQNAQTMADMKKYGQGVAVSGIADQALYQPNLGSLIFRKGNTVAQVLGTFVNPGGPPANAAQEKADVLAVAKAVVPGL